MTRRRPAAASGRTPRPPTAAHLWTAAACCRARVAAWRRTLGLLWVFCLLSVTAGAQPVPGQPDINQLLRLKAQGQWPAAQTLAQRQLARTDLPPEQRMAWQEQLALLLQQMGRHPEARAAMQEIAAIPGFASSVYVQRMPAFLADSYLAEGQRDAAVAVLARALEAIPEAQRSQPSALELRYKLAMVRFASGDYPRTADELLALLEFPEFPRRINVANMLVRLYGVEAISDTQLDQLLGKLPPADRSYEFLTMLSEAYRDRQKDKEAADLYLEIARRFPETLLPALSYMGPYLAQNGRLGDLEALVRQEVEKNPSQVPMTQLLARVLQMENKFEEALAVLGKSGDPRLRRERADLLAGAGKSAEAAAAYQQLLTASPNDPTLIEKLGAVYLRMDQREKAVSTWKRMVQGPMATQDAYQRLSDVYQRNGMTQEAVEALREARTRFPGARSSSIGMAYLWLVQGDYARALQAFSEYAVGGDGSYEFINQNIFQYLRGEQEQEELLSAVKQLYGAAAQYTPAQRAWLRDLSAQLLVKLGRYPEALAELEKTAENKDRELFQLGALLEQAGARSWAVQAYRQVGAGAPVNRASLLLHVAQLEASLGQLQAARRTLEEASGVLDARANILSGEMLLMRAELLLQLKQPGPALALLSAPDATATLRVNPQQLETAQLYRGEAWSMLGSLPRAASELASLEHSPQRDIRLLARFQLGNIHLWQNEPDQAVGYYKDIIDNELSHQLANDVLDVAVSAKLYSPEQMAHYSLALLYGWQGRDEDAVEQWRLLAALAGEGDLAADALCEAGAIYAASGDVAGASSEYGKALRFAKNPDVIGRIRWALLQDVVKARSGDVPRQDYEKLIVDFPDTLFADLARRQLRAEKPETPVEPRP